jgi:hypothetical protein
VKLHFSWNSVKSRLASMYCFSAEWTVDYSRNIIFSTNQNDVQEGCWKDGYEIGTGLRLIHERQKQQQKKKDISTYSTRRNCFIRILKRKAERHVVKLCVNKALCVMNLRT